ncbi:MAG TPA: NEW3 domain-containing protein [Dongiaceae bacterium]
MRAPTLATAILAALAFGHSAFAANTPDPASSSSYKGIWISTPYPSLGVAAGEPVELDLTVHDSGMPPQSVALAASKLPDKWTALFLGGGRPVESAFVAPNSSVDVTLRLIPPEGVNSGSYTFDVTATGDDGGDFDLPVSINFGQSVPPHLSLATELPELRGSPTSSFDYDVTLTNESGREATVRLDAAAPDGFRVAFKEGYGSQELTSIPVKPGEKRQLKVSVEPGQDVKAGTYQVGIQAATDESKAQLALALDVTGRAQLSLTGQNDRLSTDAHAGEETQVALVVANKGTAPAHGLKFSSDNPTDWKITFQPDGVDELAAGQTQEVKALVTPSAKAIAGDYMVTMTASGEGASKSSDFRFTVETSTIWGVVGILVIAAAVVVLSLAVMRFGRR